MPEEFTVTKLNFAGEKDNPHGGKLFKFYVQLQGSEGAPQGDPDTNQGIYWQRKSRELEPGEKVYGHIEQGEYGPRFKTDQRPDGAGNFQRPAYKVEGDPQAERSRRIERQHSQEMAIRVVVRTLDANALRAEGSQPPTTAIRAVIKEWTDWFAQDLDADVGSSQVAHGASDNHPSVDGDAADLSAETSGATSPADESPRAGSGVRRDGPSGDADPSRAPEEASPQQKGKLTQMFHAAGLSRDAMKAVVMWRCGQEKATKQGASQLITDLQEGATHDALLAEIWDAKRAGNPLGARAAALIPTETPADTEGLPELSDEDKAKYGVGTEVPF